MFVDEYLSLFIWESFTLLSREACLILEEKLRLKNQHNLLQKFVKEQITVIKWLAEIGEKKWGGGLFGQVLYDICCIMKQVPLSVSI